jgi:transcriptional regulator with XRE-family HTH domain
MNLVSTPFSIGRNIEKIRKLRDITQGDLALKLGITRQAVSKIEQSETIDDEKLDQIAKVLGVSADGIKNFSEAGTINYVQNNYEGSLKESSNIFANTNCTFNPFDKVMELVEENRKLYNQLVQTEREKNEILQKIVDKL